MQELGLQTLLGVGGLGEELPLLSGCVPCPQGGCCPEETKRKTFLSPGWEGWAGRGWGWATHQEGARLTQERVCRKRQQPGGRPNLLFRGDSLGRPLTAQPVRWRCFLSPVASSRPAAQVGWRRARCVGPRMPHLGERKGAHVLKWLFWVQVFLQKRNWLKNCV